MYAIVNIAGQQFKVAKDQHLLYTGYKGMKALSLNLTTF